MRTKEMTEVRACIMFPELATPTCKYIPRNALFRHESILLRGRWSEESVRRYCVAQAEKQGYNHVGLDIEYIYLDGTGDSLTVNL
jgi:hypothetical protein|nr:MAG TPA: hypothetical protein [Caudoviricetes sp.]